MIIKMNEKGFTLIELMIVVAIIGILAGIAIPNYDKYRKKSCDAASKVQIFTVKDVCDPCWRMSCKKCIVERKGYKLSLYECLECSGRSRSFFPDEIEFSLDGEFSYAVNGTTILPDTQTTISAITTIGYDSIEKMNNYSSIYNSCGSSTICRDSSTGGIESVNGFDLSACTR